MKRPKRILENLSTLAHASRKVEIIFGKVTYLT